MGKYIDADLLRKEIERRIEILKKAEIDWAEQGDTETSVYYSGKSVALDEFTDFIDSLQQEQQEVDLDSEIEEYWIATEWSKVITLGKFKVIARYFYGLGQLNSE